MALGHQIRVWLHEGASWLMRSKLAPSIIGRMQVTQRVRV